MPLPARLPLASFVAMGLAVLLHVRELAIDPVRGEALPWLEAGIVLMVGGALGLASWRPSWRRRVWVAATNGVSLLVCGYFFWVAAPLESIVFSLALVLAAAGLIFPWGFRGQLAASVGAALGLALVAASTPPGVGHTPMGAVTDLGVVIGVLSLGAYAVGTRARRDRELFAALDAAREEAQKANRTQSEFLANMSHEMRTPMNVIFGMTDMALDADLSPSAREALRRTRAAAGNLLLLVNDVLDFSKMEAGSLRLEARPFVVRRWLDETLEPLTWLARDKGLEFRWEVEPSVDEAVIGDGGRLAQVVVNLVSNAIKFTDLGAVRVRVAPAPPSAFDGQSQRRLHFSVQDTGVGIPEGLRGEILKAFAQGSTERTMNRGGTGLGLAICSGLVRLMDGQLWFESEVDRGSTFHFVVRVERATPSELARLGDPAERSALQPEPVRRLVTS